jgi:hypothetical protein
MKTLKKNVRFIAAFAVALILVSALVVGCPNSSSPSGSKGGFTVIAPPDNPQGAGPGVTPSGPVITIPAPEVIPEGKGSVILKLTSYVPPPEPGRTVIPAAIDIDDFTTFNFVFTPINPVGANITVPITTDDFTGISLAPGDYTLVVTGSTAVGPAATASSADGGVVSTDRPVTVGVPAAGFTILTAQATTLAINLSHILLPSTAVGQLNWTNVTFSGFTPNSAVITPGEYVSGDTEAEANLLGTGKTANYPSGYYWLDFYITTSGGGVIDYSDIVHIYPGMQSIIPALQFIADEVYIVIPPGSAAGGITYTEFTPPGEVPITFGAALTANSVNNLNDGDGTKGNPYILSLAVLGGYPLELTFTATTVGLTNLVWRSRGTEVSTGNTWTLATGATNFAAPALISITVAGNASGVPFSSTFYIRIVP